MASPSQEITKTEFKENYNVVKVLTDKIEIMKQLQSFNPKKQAVAFGVRKQPGEKTPNWFKEYAKSIDEKFDLIMERLDKIENRLDKHDEMFKQHGWM